MRNISIIIPTLNESANILKLITQLQMEKSGYIKEIIVVDGGSKDNTLTIANNLGAKAIVSPLKGRASQMNYGAAISTGDIFYFVHADTLPPIGFSEDILKSIQKGNYIGRFCTRFSSNNLLLKFNAFFTRFDLFVCYGGDQTLFITKELFGSLNGFDESLKIMEDYDIVKRAKKKSSYGIVLKDVLISARKYEKNNWWKVQKANFTIVQMYKKGASQEEMVEKYKKMLVDR